MSRPNLSVLMIGGALALGGCAADRGDYPSLLPRPAEKMSMGDPVRPEPVSVPDAALDGDVAALDQRLAASARAFNALAPEAEAAVAVAQGVAAGSDSWYTAQSQLAALEGARGATSGLLADIDRIAADRAIAGKPPYPALDALRTRASAESDRQSGIIAQLGVALRGG